MPTTSIHYHPSLESSAPTEDTAALRPSLYDAKDDFIERVAPIGMAAMYFGSFSLAPQDIALSRQALFKLSFANRHFLQPSGLRILVQRETAVLSGSITNRALVVMADILARQIKGINHVTDETKLLDAPSAKTAKLRDIEAIREAVTLLFATDQTLRSGVQVLIHEGRLTLEGQVTSAAQKNWADQLAAAAGAEVQSKLKVLPPNQSAQASSSSAPQVDDESLQALVLFRLRLVRDTEHLPIRAKTHRGIVSLQGKVRTEALRQRAENLARSTLGLRELRSTISIAP